MINLMLCGVFLTTIIKKVYCKFCNKVFGLRYMQVQVLPPKYMGVCDCEQVTFNRNVVLISVHLVSCSSSSDKNTCFWLGNGCPNATWSYLAVDQDSEPPLRFWTVGAWRSLQHEVNKGRQSPGQCKTKLRARIRPRYLSQPISLLAP